MDKHLGGTSTASGDSSPASPRFFRGIPWLSGVAVMLLLWWSDVSFTPVPPAPALDLQLQFPVGIPSRSEPIIATGYLKTGTYLFVTFIGTNSAVFTYHARDESITSPLFTFDPTLSYPTRIELPAIANAGARDASPKGTLRVTVNGHDLLKKEVNFDLSSPGRLYFGENPVGGLTLGTVFRGAIKTGAGTETINRRGPPASTSAKVRAWSKTWWHIFPILLASAAIAALVRSIAEPRATRTRTALHNVARFGRIHAAFLTAAALNLILFAWLMTGGKFRLIYPDAFGAVYDLQAQSLLQGKLELPTDALGGEAFIVDNKHYTYFGLTPALLRVPLVAFNIGTGHLTRSFMLFEYLACLIASYLLLRHATRLLGGRERRPSAWAVFVMITAAGSGSTLLFLGSRAYVYHEAILCGVAFALWSTYFSLCYLQDRRTRWWLGAVVCLIFAANSRATIGLFALGVLGGTALLHVISGRKDPRLWRVPLGVGALACAAFLSLNAVAYFKFHSFNAAPHHLNVQYSKERLDRIEGKNFHLANLRHNLDAYLLRPAFNVGSRFPFFVFELPRKGASSAKMDLEEPIVSLVYAMSGLVFLGLISLASLPKAESFRRPLLLIILASVPLVAVMLTFIATSHRYTADFCPPLIATAAFGLAYCDHAPRKRRSILLSFASATTAFAAVLTLGLSFHFQVDLVWGVPEEVRLNYFNLRDRTDPWFGMTPR